MNGKLCFLVNEEAFSIINNCVVCFIHFVMRLEYLFKYHLFSYIPADLTEHWQTHLLIMHGFQLAS